MGVYKAQILNPHSRPLNLKSEALNSEPCTLSSATMTWGGGFGFTGLFGVSGVPNCVFRSALENEDVQCDEDPKGDTTPRTALT